MYAENYLAHMLAGQTEHNSLAPFLVSDTQVPIRSYKTFFEQAERMARVLWRAGVRPGDRVAAQAPKTVATLELYVATLLVGGIFLPLNTAYTPQEVEYFLNDAEPRVFVCGPKNASVLSGVAYKAGVAEIFTLSQDECGSLTLARDAQAPGFEAVPRTPEELAAIVYTSGTTGRSKGAMLSHRALASNAKTLCDLWRFTAHDRLIHALPIFHTHGLFVATNIVLIAGASAIFLPKFDAETVISIMPHASAMMGVPTFYTRLLEHAGLSDASQNMRLFVSGSAPLLAETHKTWTERTGHKILERYGMTETNMNTSNPYDGERRAGSVGFALPGVAMRIVDPASQRPVLDGETGMIEVKGDNLFSGYWQMPQKTAQDMREDGFFITGDLGRIDDNGYLHIVGRVKDLIIAGGYNIYPKEIELVFDALPGVLESAVIGVPHPDLGEGVVAVVVFDGSVQQDEASLLDAVKEKLARFKQPRHVAIVKDLPRNTMGKVQKNLLRETFARCFQNPN